MGGCATPLRNPISAAQVAANPAPAAELYRIEAGDELEIRFFYTPDLNTELPVRPDGYISLPFAKRLLAAGKTPDELALDLEERYSLELKEPEIAVIVRSFTGHQVHVGGEVDEPGALAVLGQMTVLDAVVQAGGLLDTAYLEQVLVIRPYVDGQRVVTVDLEGVLNGEDTSQNIPVYPYDVVFVPKSPIANVNMWVDQYLRRNIPINFGFRQNVN